MELESIFYHTRLILMPAGGYLPSFKSWNAWIELFPRATIYGLEINKNIIFRCATLLAVHSIVWIEHVLSEQW